MACFGQFLDVLTVFGIGVLADLAWPVAITAGIAILLIKLGLIKPLNVFVDGFKQIIKIAGPPFKDLVSQFGRLWDAFGKGKGAFAIIKPILEFLISQVLSRGIKRSCHLHRYHVCRCVQDPGWCHRAGR